MISDYGNRFFFISQTFKVEENNVYLLVRSGFIGGDELFVYLLLVRGFLVSSRNNKMAKTPQVDL